MLHVELTPVFSFKKEVSTKLYAGPNLADFELIRYELRATPFIALSSCENHSNAFQLDGLETIVKDMPSLGDEYFGVDA